MLRSKLLGTLRLFLGSLALLSLFPAFAVKAATPSAVLSAVASASSVTIGSNVTVDIRLTSQGERASAVEVYLAIPGNFSYVSSDTTNSVMSFAVEGVSVQNGVLRFSRARLDEGYLGSNGFVIQLSFQATAAGAGQFSIQQGTDTSQVIAYSDSSQILQSVQNATVTAQNAATPTPTPETTPTPATPTPTPTPASTPSGLGQELATPTPSSTQSVSTGSSTSSSGNKGTQTGSSTPIPTASSGPQTPSQTATPTPTSTTPVPTAENPSPTASSSVEDGASLLTGDSLATEATPITEKDVAVVGGSFLGGLLLFGFFLKYSLLFRKIGKYY